MQTETLKPFPNMPPDTGFAGSLKFKARLFFDFSVATVYRDLRRFLEGHGAVRTLEIGCGFSPYAHLVKSERYWSLESYSLEKEFGYFSKSVKYDGSRFPFKTGSFDVLFHTEVMEHIFDTRFFLEECARVLKPGGAMFFTVPFAARYHYKPHDYWRFTPSALRALCEARALTVASLEPRGDALVVILNKIMVFTMGLTLGRKENPAARWSTRILSLPFTAILIPLLGAVGQVFLKTGWVRNTDDCLGFSVVCLKPRS